MRIGSNSSPDDPAKRRLRITVFCGSRLPADPVYARAAADLGTAIAEGGADLVYGGAGVGTMLALADAALAASGAVFGVIPDELREREQAHAGITELHVVDSIAERKTLLVELGDAFVALPGGLGTLDELFEVAVRAQIGLHDKPIVLVNLAGYYDGLVGFLDHAVTVGMMRPAHRDTFVVVETVPEAVALALALGRADATAG